MGNKARGAKTETQFGSKKTKGRGRRRYSEKEKLGRGGRKRTGISGTIEKKSKLGV